MLLNIRALLLSVLMSVGLISFAGDSIKSHQSVGLVLSGGGAKGIAHIGVIKALEENNIPIDYIAGTSMGAIVGGLYAAGYSPDEMLALIASEDFANWSTGRIDEKYVYYFAKSAPSPAMLKVSVGKPDSTRTVHEIPSSLISPLPMNFAFMELFSQYTAQCGGDFDKLFVPFRCIAADVHNKRKVVCRNGDLGDAIRASMTFPIAFQPIKIDGVYMYDGGIYDNFPVSTMREDFAPDIILGVNIASSENKEQPTSMFGQLEEMIMNETDYSVPADEGIYMRIKLDEFGLLDFPKGGEIYQRGYSKTIEMMDSIKSRIHTRISPETRDLKRRVFKSKLPYLKFDSVTVSGGNKYENEYIKYLFTKDKSDTIDIDHARNAYYVALSSGKLKNLHPKAVYNADKGIFDLNMNVAVKDNMQVGFGGYITSSTNSMIYLSGSYRSTSFRSVAADIEGWIGQSYMAASANVKLYFRTRVPSAVNLQAVIYRQKFYESDKLFYEDNMPTFITNNEVFTRLNYSIAAGRSAIASIGVGYGYLQDDFFHSNTVDYSHDGKDKSTYSLGQFRLNYEYNTLDRSFCPTQGTLVEATAMGLIGSYHFNPYDNIYSSKENRHLKWLQIRLSSQNYWNVNKRFTIGTEMNIFASTRKLLNNYTATIVAADAFNPTASSYNAFNPAFRANSYVTAGIIPIWKIGSNMQLRTTAHMFLPFRKIKEDTLFLTPYYGKWFSDPEFFGELAFVYNFPFASLKAHCNYMSYPSSNWNVGISFGVFILAPKFLK